MRKALFVIDVQNYFINSKTKILPLKIFDFITKNKDDFELIIFSRFINSRKSSVYRFLNWKKCLNSPETDIVSELQPLLRFGVIISKNVYSVLKTKEAKNLLNKYRIQELYLCGMDTDSCVLATAFDAFDQGYKIHFLKDLTQSSANGNVHESSLKIFRRNLLSL